MQLSAIRKKYVHANPDGFFILAGVASKRNFVACFQGHVSPAQADQIARIIQFDAPICDLAVAVLGVEKNLAMGIGPHESRYGALHGNSLCEVVALGTVVGNDRPAIE